MHTGLQNNLSMFPTFDTPDYREREAARLSFDIGLGFFLLSMAYIHFYRPSTAMP